MLQPSPSFGEADVEAHPPAGQRDRCACTRQGARDGFQAARGRRARRVGPPEGRAAGRRCEHVPDRRRHRQGVGVGGDGRFVARARKARQGQPRLLPYARRHRSGQVPAAARGGAHPRCVRRNPRCGWRERRRPERRTRRPACTGSSRRASPPTPRGRAPWADGALPATFHRSCTVRVDCFDSRRVGCRRRAAQRFATFRCGSVIRPCAAFCSNFAAPRVVRGPPRC